MPPVPHWDSDWMAHNIIMGTVKRVRQQRMGTRQSWTMGVTKRNLPSSFS